MPQLSVAPVSSFLIDIGTDAPASSNAVATVSLAGTPLAGDTGPSRWAAVLRRGRGCRDHHTWTASLPRGRHPHRELDCRPRAQAGARHRRAGRLRCGRQRHRPGHHAHQRARPSRRPCARSAAPSRDQGRHGGAHRHLHLAGLALVDGEQWRVDIDQSGSSTSVTDTALRRFDAVAASDRVRLTDLGGAAIAPQLAVTPARNFAMLATNRSPSWGVRKHADQWQPLERHPARPGRVQPDLQRRHRGQRLRPRRQQRRQRRGDLRAQDQRGEQRRQGRA